MKKQRLSPRSIARFLGRLTPRVRPYLTSLIAASVILVVSTAIALAFPLIVRELLDAAFLEGSGELLNLIAIGLLALFALQAVLNFAQSYLTASVAERVIADLRNDLFAHLLRQPPGFFSLRRVGELSSRIASDAALIQNVLRFGIPELARQGIFLVGALALVTATNPRLTLVTLTAIPIAAGVGWFFGRRVRHLSTGIQDHLASAVARAEQAFTQIRTVQAFTREAWERDRFGVEIGRTRDEGLKRAVARAALTGAVTFAAFGAIVVVLWEGGRLVLAGELSPGTLVAFLLYAVTISGAITSLAGFYGNLNEAAGAARHIFELLDDEPILVDPPEPIAFAAPVRGTIAYRDVHFRYGPDLPYVLRGIDLEIEEGETVALVGSSGAGKSTLASLLPRFFDVEHGSVSIDGVDVRAVRLEDLRSVIGIVPQEPMLFAGTVRENLLYGDFDATEADLDEVAAAAHADIFIRDRVRSADRGARRDAERRTTSAARDRARDAQTASHPHPRRGLQLPGRGVGAAGTGRARPAHEPLYHACDRASPVDGDSRGPHRRARRRGHLSRRVARQPARARRRVSATVPPTVRGRSGDDDGDARALAAALQALLQQRQGFLHLFAKRGLEHGARHEAQHARRLALDRHRDARAGALACPKNLVGRGDRRAGHRLEYHALVRLVRLHLVAVLHRPPQELAHIVAPRAYRGGPRRLLFRASKLRLPLMLAADVVHVGENVRNRTLNQDAIAVSYGRHSSPSTTPSLPSPIIAGTTPT